MAGTVRAATTQDAATCEAIVLGLPDFFTDDVPDKVRGDLRDHGGWVIDDAREVVGFVVVERRGPRAAEILWAAVAADRRGAGLGTRLIDHVLEKLGADGVQIVEVKTLDASADYEPYEATRAFWLARGFVQFDMIDPLPGRRPGNPAAILAAALAPTR
jgi:ribosomal protein S18 acetylase RimI-like enzyme